MVQAQNQSRQDAAIIREFVESFEDNFKHAERIWTANPDLRDRMTRENSKILDARFEAAGGIAWCRVVSTGVGLRWTRFTP